MNIRSVEGDDVRNVLEGALQRTRRLPSGTAKLGLLCKCAIRLWEHSKPDEAMKLFKEARSMLKDIPVDHGRKYLLQELALASARLSLLSEGKALVLELEELCKHEAPSPFRSMATALIVQSWAALGCFDEVQRVVSGVVADQRARLFQVALTQAASDGHWFELSKLLMNSAVKGSIPDEVAAELLLRLSQADLPSNERAAIMKSILESAESAALAGGGRDGALRASVAR